jgi:Glutamyl-tRNA reductase
VVWRLSQDFFKDKLPQSVLFVGYSELTRLLIPSFLRKGVDQITLCTKRPSSVQLSPCEVVGREALHSWFRFDLIICASKADGYLIQGSGASGRLVFDLSVPRNVDPRVGQTSQLYNMEQINACVERSLKQHMIYIDQSEKLVKTSVHHLARIYKHKQIARSAILSCSNPS